jgi:hypothetical protein
MKDPNFETIDIKSFKERTMLYKKEAMERLRNILTKPVYKIVAEEEESPIFHYQIPSAHSYSALVRIRFLIQHYGPDIKR